MLICYIRLLCDWWFHHYHHITYICCFLVLTVLASIWLVLMALFSVAIRSYSVSLLKFSFLSHVHFFACQMLLISRLKRPCNCFSSRFCFLVIVVLFVFSTVLGGSNQSFSALLYFIFKSFYWCVNAVFNASKYFSSFFSLHIESVNLISGMNGH